MISMSQKESQEFSVSYAERIANELNVDITTCPHCGQVSIQPNDTEDCTCPICGAVADFSDFPSLFYSGMEWVEEVTGVVNPLEDSRVILTLPDKMILRRF